MTILSIIIRKFAIIKPNEWVWSFEGVNSETVNNNMTGTSPPITYVGEHAGQSVFHCHMHLIPRYKGDVPNPKGGVRGVIPSMQKYWEN